MENTSKQQCRRRGPPKEERQNIHLLFSVARAGEQDLKATTTETAILRTPNHCGTQPSTSITFCLKKLGENMYRKEKAMTKSAKYNLRKASKLM